MPGTVVSALYGLFPSWSSRQLYELGIIIIIQIIKRENLSLKELNNILVLQPLGSGTLD